MFCCGQRAVVRRAFPRRHFEFPEAVCAIEVRLCRFRPGKYRPSKAVLPDYVRRESISASRIVSEKAKLHPYAFNSHKPYAQPFFIGQIQNFCFDTPRLCSFHQRVAIFRCTAISSIPASKEQNGAHCGPTDDLATDFLLSRTHR